LTGLLLDAIDLRDMTRLLFLGLLLLGSLMLVAQPPHDACARARRIEPGDALLSESNRMASIEAAVLPATQPVTCIKTYENDLWYTFTTQAEYQYYQLRVEPLMCETPAGLQFLLIKADTCAPDSFSYTACLNPYATEPLEVFWENPVPGETYLIQVDGYDGNICAFSLSLDGFGGDTRSELDLRRMRYDPNHPKPDFLEANLRGDFINNAVTLQWRSSTREDVSFFLIERVRWGSRDSTLSGTVVGLVEATDLVGSQESVEYQYTIDKAFQDEQRYCYQVVKVDADLRRAYSMPICLEADLIEDFFISEVFPYEKEPPGVYAIKYINRKRQDLTFEVYDAAGSYLKGYTRKREPLTDGIITIDMREYAPGEYLLKVIGKRGSYQRPFLVK